MADFSDMKALGDEFLAHHGIEGQHWGVKNGPPYPLNEEGKAKFKKKFKEFKEKSKEKKRIKRRKKILRNPEKLAKYNEEFTLEEIADAIKRFDAISEIKKRIPKDIKSGLSLRQRTMASNPGKLAKNIDRFDEDDYKKAYDRLKKQRDLQEMAIADAARPAKILGVGNAYLNEVASGISKIKGGVSDFTNIHDAAVKITGTGPTYSDKYDKWAKEHGYSNSGGKGVNQKDVDAQIEKYLKDKGLI